MSGAGSPASRLAKACDSAFRSSGWTRLKNVSALIVSPSFGSSRYANQRRSMVSRLLSGSKNHGKIFVCDNAVSRMNFRDISSSVSRNRNTTRRNFLCRSYWPTKRPSMWNFSWCLRSRMYVRGGRSPQSLCCCSPSKIAGKRSFWYWQTENRSEILSGWEKSPPPRRSTLYACMLISVNSPSGVSSMQATETRLSVSHTAGTCIPAGLLRWKRRNFILGELRT